METPYRRELSLTAGLVLVLLLQKLSLLLQFLLGLVAAWEALEGLEEPLKLLYTVLGRLSLES